MVKSKILDGIVKLMERTALWQDEGLEVEKIDGSLSPNMRALRLSMVLADNLLSMGVSASDVVHMCAGVTDVYCTRKAHLDVSSTLLLISQDRGNDREPLTLVRPVAMRDTDYSKIQALQRIALSVRNKRMQLSEAEKAVEDALAAPTPYPHWLRYLAGGGLSAGIIILYAGTPLMIFLAFIMGSFVSAITDTLINRGLTIFYTQIVVALFITLVASVALYYNIDYSLGMNPTLLLISGIVMLVAGMMIVGAFQDAIDEFFVTANARLLNVFITTGGIVIGVLMGLYVATKLGVAFPATPDRLPLAEMGTRYVGAFVIALSFALGRFASFSTLVVAGLAGLMSYFTLQVMLDLGLGTVSASAIAAAAVGLFATFSSRFWHFPSIAIMSAAIVPLVPGLALYNGLMSVVEFPPGHPQFLLGVNILLRATAIGLSVAAGVTLGGMIGRPLRRGMAQLTTRLPRRILSVEQVEDAKN